MPTILATTSSFGTACPEAVQSLLDSGYRVETNPYGRKLTEQELNDLLQKFKPVGLLAGTEPVTGAVLEHAHPFLSVISRIGVGWDNVDHAKAGELGISVHRTEGVLDQAVAELSVGMMLDALRHITRHDRDLRAGIWKKRMGRLLADKTVGVVGFGAIGRRVSELCMAFGAKVVCADLCCIEAECVEQRPLDSLIREADIVSVHASGSNCLIDAAMLKGCKEGVIIVNTARGGMIDEAALAEGLRSGQIGYACMDVFQDEPYQGPLKELDNTVLTTHIGSYAQEARVAMESLAVENLLAGLQSLKDGDIK